MGKPLDHVELRIVDDEGSPLPAGQSGTVLAKGASITPGYFRNEDATRESYRDGWLITGDLGYLDDLGYLTLVGRTAHFLKIRGLRISFHEIEQLGARFQQSFVQAASHGKDILVAPGAVGLGKTSDQRLPYFTVWVTPSWS